MTDLRLEELSAATAAAANSLTLKPGQEQFVQPTSYAQAESDVKPSASWPRVVLDGDEVVRTAKFQPNQAGPGSHVANASFMVDPRHAGRGIGRRLAEHVLELARAEGAEHLTVHATPDAAAFYQRFGFEPGPTIAQLDLR